MTQHTYDNESVQELLNWAKKMLETKNYPTEKYELNKCTTIINGKTYLESLVAMIGRNWENPTFHPTIDQLWEFREKWEGKEENKKRLSCNSWGITLCNFPFMHTPLLIYTGRTSYLPLHEMKP